MKCKAVFYFMFLTAISVTAVVGCSKEKKMADDVKREENVSINQNNEKSEEKETVISKNAIVDLEKYQNIKEVISENDFIISSEFSDLKETSEAIVEAEIQSVEYLSFEGMAITKLDLKVLNVLSGDLEVNDEITLYKDGGYIPLSEFIKYSGGESMYSDIESEQIENTLLHDVIDGEADYEPGEVAVYFLAKTDRPFIPADGYERVCGQYAVLKKTEEGKYRHQNMGFSETNREFDDLTLEEIKQEIKE